MGSMGRAESERYVPRTFDGHAVRGMLCGPTRLQAYSAMDFQSSVAFQTVRIVTNNHLSSPRHLLVSSRRINHEISGRSWSI